jgi:transposase-like protein
MIDDSIIEEHSVTCPACDHEQDEAECYLGTLGPLTHYRCRFCGMTFNQDGGVHA